jgi:hypothetical protein
LAQGHDPEVVLPDGISYNGDPELAFSVWAILEASRWHWTINDVLEQPEQLLNDILMISAINAKMNQIEREQNAHR